MNDGEVGPKPIFGGPPPRLSRVNSDERSRFVALITLAIIVSVLVGGCGVGSSGKPYNVFSICVVAMKLSLIGLSWWSFAFWLSYLSFRRELDFALARYGKERIVVNRIDAEPLDVSNNWVRGRWPPRDSGRPDFVAVSQNWQVQVKPYRAAVFRLEELMWMYKRVVPRWIWVRKTSYRFQLGCRLRDGTVMNIEAGEETIDELAEELLERCPALLTGWRARCSSYANAAQMRWRLRMKSAPRRSSTWQRKSARNGWMSPLTASRAPC